MKIVCVQCQTELKPKTNGVGVIEMAGTNPYRLWRADLLACPGCGFEVVSGFAPRHVAHYEATFVEQVEKAKQQAPQIIYDYERAQVARGSK